jgi:hypothetical protein
MPSLLGTRELGIYVKWSFGFVGHGSSATTTPGVVYLDVGNRLCRGVLDQHQDDSLGGCTSDLIVSHPEYVYNHLLDEVLSQHARGLLPAGTTLHLRIITHVNPDWDGMVSAFLVQRLVEDGELPAYTPALVAYSRDVDQGRFSIRRYLEAGESGLRALSLLPHLAGLVVTYTHRDHAEALAAGMSLVRATIDGLLAAVPGPWSWTQDTFETLQWTQEGPQLAPGAGAWAKRNSFGGYSERIMADLDVWKAESADAAREDILLPVDARESRVVLEPVPSILLRRPSKSMLNKYWARAEGFLLFVCPYAGGMGSNGSLGTDEVSSRVVISLPDDAGSWPAHQRPAHFRGLGALLEREETRLRLARSQRRVGRPRWDDAAYCDNADPWYDGRGHFFRILDTPRVGTLLPYANIVAHLKNARAWAPLDVEAADLTVDFHLSLPDAAPPMDGPDAEPLRAQSAWGPGGLSGTLRTWLDQTRTRDVSGALARFFQPSRGMRVERAILRDIRPLRGAAPHVFPPMLHVTLHRDAQGSDVPRLGEVIDSIVGLERLLSGVREPPAEGEGAPDRAFVAVSWSPSPDFRGDVSSMERARQRLGATQARSDQVWVGPRAVVREHAPSSSTTARDVQDASKRAFQHAVYGEMLGYVAFVDATLSRVSEQIARAVLTLEGATPQRGPRVAVSDVRNEFLLFQGLYYQPEVSANPRVQGTCDDVRAALKLDTHYREVESELDRLAQVETARADARMTTVMELLTLVSLVGSIDAIAQGINEWRGSTSWLRIVLSAVTILAVLLLRQRYRASTR